MAVLKRKQAVLIVLSLVLFLIIYLAPGPAPSKKEEMSDKSEIADSKDFNELIVQSYTGLTPDQIGLTVQYGVDTVAADSQKKKAAFDSLAALWFGWRNLALSAFYAERSAIVSGTAGDWNKIGERYHDAAYYDQQFGPELYQRAIAGFDQALKIDSGFSKSKLNKGICLVESGSNPMQGITLIRGIADADPQNKEAQFRLGYFSMQSAQYDKAIQRFEKVLEIDPNAYEVYFYLGEAFAGAGNKQKAIEQLQLFIDHQTDVEMIKQIENRINELKKS